MCGFNIFEQSTRYMQTEQLLCWSGMTDTEHSKTSSSNKEEEVHIRKIENTTIILIIYVELLLTVYS